MTKGSIFELKTHIHELENEINDLQKEVSELDHQLTNKKRFLTFLKSVVSQEEYDLRQKEKDKDTGYESVKDILVGLVDQANGRYELLQELGKIRTDMFKGTDQEDFEIAITYLKGMSEEE